MMRKLSFCLWRGLRDDEVSGMKDWRCMTYGVHNLHWTDSPCSIWLNWPQSRETQGWNGNRKWRSNTRLVSSFLRFAGD